MIRSALGAKPGGRAADLMGGEDLGDMSAMLTWLGDLDARERRTMGACLGGWALDAQLQRRLRPCVYDERPRLPVGLAVGDAFDVQMYSFVIPTVIAPWGLSGARKPTRGIFAGGCCANDCENAEANPASPAIMTCRRFAR